MTWNEFFSMGGYALYVWGSYITAAILMIGEVIFLIHRKRSLSDRRTAANDLRGIDGHETTS